TSLAERATPIRTPGRAAERARDGRSTTPGLSLLHMELTSGNVSRGGSREPAESISRWSPRRGPGGAEGLRAGCAEAGGVVRWRRRPDCEPHAGRTGRRHPDPGPHASYSEQLGRSRARPRCRPRRAEPQGVAAAEPAGAARPAGEHAADLGDAQPVKL